MGHSVKTEFPPLLSSGIHRLSLSELKRLCGDPFPDSTTRPRILNSLESVMRELKLHGIQGRIWVDGSLLTKKIDPEDSDVVLVLLFDFLENANEQQIKILDWFVGDSLKRDFLCDSYVAIQYPEGDPNNDRDLGKVRYWRDFFGHARNGKPKGIACVHLEPPSAPSRRRGGDGLRSVRRLRSRRIL